jgi:hypothetical protein
MDPNASKRSFAQRRHGHEFRPEPDLDFEYCRTLVPGERGRLHLVETHEHKEYNSGKKKVDNPILHR